MNIDKKALKGVVDEIEASRARQKAETEFQREAMKRAAKVHNLDAKAIRIVLSRRAMGDEKRDEQDYYVHAYEVALGGKKLAADALASGATVREAAAIGGISTGAAGNLAKVVQKSSKMDTPHDSDGVVTENNQSQENRNERATSISAAATDRQAGGEGSGGGMAGGSLAEASERGAEAGRSDAGHCGQTEGEPVSALLNEAPAPRSVGAVGPSSARVAPPDLEMPPIPDFLRRGAA